MMTLGVSSKLIDEEVAEMHKNDESADVMTEKMVDEVETKVAEDDAMLARRISEAKRLAESAKNENEPSSARSGASSRRTSFSFDMPKFVEDAEKDEEEKEKKLPIRIRSILRVLQRRRY